MLTVYLVALLAGGAILALTVLGGGHDDAAHDTGGDGGHDHDFDGGHDHDLDAGHGADHDGAADIAAHQAGAHAAEGRRGGLSPLALLLSIRFWTFFAAFFGLTGCVFDLLHLAPQLGTLLASTGVGFVCGTAAVVVLRSLRQQDTSIGESHFVGREGEVLLSVEPGTRGRVRLAVKGQVVDFAAEAEDRAPRMEKGERVLVLGLRDGVARVAPLRRESGAGEKP